MLIHEKGYGDHAGFNVPRFIDSWDGMATSVNLFVPVDGRVVGAVRLLISNPEIAGINGARHGLDIEKKVRISAPAHAVLGEVMRFCIDPDLRGSALYLSMLRKLRRIARAAGLTHIVAFADLQTDDAASAAAVCAAEVAKGHVNKAFRVEVLPGAPQPPAEPTRSLPSCSGDDGTVTVRTGATLRTFLRSGAKIIGDPRLDELGTFAVPIALPLTR